MGLEGSSIGSLAHEVVDHHIRDLLPLAVPAAERTFDGESPSGGRPLAKDAPVVPREATMRDTPLPAPTSPRRRARRLGSFLALASLLLSSLAVGVSAHPQAAAADTPAFTGAYLDSEADAYVGDGQQLTFPAAQVQVSSRGSGTLAGNTARFVVGVFPDQFEMWFATPAADAHFSVGTYTDVVRFGASPDNPGLDVFGQGRGCNTVGGRFTVLEVAYSGDVITSFAARFQMECESAGAAARVFGGVWWSAHAAYTTRTIAPNSLDFPTVHSGQTTAAQAVTVTNDGPAALHNAGVELTGFDAGDFTITSDSCLGATMAAGGSCSVSVAFSPSDSPVGPPGPKNGGAAPVRRVGTRRWQWPCDRPAGVVDDLDRERERAGVRRRARRVPRARPWT